MNAKFSSVTTVEISSPRSTMQAFRCSAAGFYAVRGKEVKPNFKYAIIHRHRGRYPLNRMCRFFEISRSGYYKYVKQLTHPAKDFELVEKIRTKQKVAGSCTSTATRVPNAPRKHIS